VAVKAGLNDAEAQQEVVQETVISVAKQMPGFRYDPTRGTFKGWLLKITRRRIADQASGRRFVEEGSEAFAIRPVIKRTGCRLDFFCSPRHFPTS